MSVSPAGQPSITAPSAVPCDSPKVLTRNKVPNILPAIYPSSPTGTMMQQFGWLTEISLVLMMSSFFS